MSYNRLFTDIHASANDSPADQPALSLDGIQAITFDAGGTLVHAWPPVGTAYAEVLADHGIEADGEVLQERFMQFYKKATERPRERIDLEAERIFWRKVVAETVADVCPQEQLDSVFDALWNAYASSDRWRLYPGAKDTVRRCKEKGYRVFLLSNADSRFRQTFEELGFGDIFEELFISSEIGYEKPDPRIFHHVREKIACKPEQILHIGDSPFHDGAAATLGWNVAILGKEIQQITDVRAALGHS
ncbi:MAG: HAD-IA family hydrolase [Opitutales bacterium]|nr:HAD-IA family hydrolase [Opitutales bacterium]